MDTKRKIELFVKVEAPTAKVQDAPSMNRLYFEIPEVEVKKIIADHFKERMCSHGLEADYIKAVTLSAEDEYEISATIEISY